MPSFFAVFKLSPLKCDDRILHHNVVVQALQPKLFRRSCIYTSCCLMIDAIYSIKQILLLWPSIQSETLDYLAIFSRVPERRSSLAEYKVFYPCIIVLKVFNNPHLHPSPLLKKKGVRKEKKLFQSSNTHNNQIKTKQSMLPTP